ncbi:nitroreductase/quinone reductase family protein [Actinosynnema sp. ALI-1.44]|uniref:nitroreductase/quinone reductase family protein n=1 Tax=Actinosynnema sp. ALI-1.44 TaxID=1933779 RepID=UPI00192CEB88|nr:nitroreductase/quinone reductase family protein [Actinosynnema sp. ALI-1.44]
MDSSSAPPFRSRPHEHSGHDRVDRLRTGRVSVHLPNHIRRAIEITPAAGTENGSIDITTLGCRTGRARRIEIFFYRAAGTTYLCSGAGGAATDWHANLLANPDFTFHLKTGICADLPVRATPVTYSAERQAVLAEIVANLNQPYDLGTIRPTRLEDRG